MLKKENFAKLIKAVIFQIEKDRLFSSYLEEFSDSHYLLTISEETIMSIIDVLEIEMDDPERNGLYDSIISWWLFDAPEAGKDKDSCYIETKKGKILLETPEQLYDYLLECSEEK